jgi:hypothetical protein
MLPSPKRPERLNVTAYFTSYRPGVARGAAPRAPRRRADDPGRSFLSAIAGPAPQCGAGQLAYGPQCQVSFGLAIAHAADLPVGQLSCSSQSMWPIPGPPLAELRLPGDSALGLTPAQKCAPRSST